MPFAALPTNNAMLSPGPYTTTLLIPDFEREETNGLTQFLGLRFILDGMF